MRKREFRVWTGWEMDYEPPISLISSACINDFFYGKDVTEFTGEYLKDKKIWEGDIIGNELGPWCIVEYIYSGYHLRQLRNDNTAIWGPLKRIFDPDMRDIYNFLDIIGNVSENPEMI